MYIKKLGAICNGGKVVTRVFLWDFSKSYLALKENRGASCNTQSYIHIFLF